jgi:hypothetical protein
MVAATAASTFRLDVKGSEIRQAFNAAGIRTVLLKGPAFGRLLYRDPSSRSYSDVDLLVDPAAVRAAEEILVILGFRRFEDESTVRQIDTAVGKVIGAQGASHSTAWVRHIDNFVVDIHDSLPQVGAPERVVWQQLTQHLDVLIVGGVPAETLDRPASALLVALHAAHHGPDWDRAITDLERALEVFDGECWEAARDLAVKLHAEAPMGVGLGLTEAGRDIAGRLSLPTEPSPAIRLLWAGAPWSAGFIESLIRQRDPRATATLIARLLWPSPTALRRGSALARRGPRGLLAAYALRPFQLARRLPAAVRTRWRARI